MLQHLHLRVAEVGYIFILARFFFPVVLHPTSPGPCHLSSFYFILLELHFNILQYYNAASHSILSMLICSGRI